MKNLYYLFILSFLLISCEEKVDSINPNENFEIEAAINGLVQKGPFLSGSDLTLFELDSNLNQTGKSFTSRIEDNLGSYDLGSITLSSDLVKIIADGFYWNEVTGNNSDSRLSLSLISKVSDDNKININVLTALSSPRIEYLMKQGMNYDDAEEKSRKEVLNIFGFNSPSTSSFSTFDISNNSNDDGILLAISVIIQGYRKDSEVNELIQNMATDLKEDGIIDSNTTMSKLLSHVSSISTDKVKNQLKARYEELGKNISIPDFEKYLIEFDKDSLIDRNHYPISYPSSEGGRPNLLDLDRIIYPAWSPVGIFANIPAGGSLKIIAKQIGSGPIIQPIGIEAGGLVNMELISSEIIDNGIVFDYLDTISITYDTISVDSINIIYDIDSIFKEEKLWINTFESLPNDNDFKASVKIGGASNGTPYLIEYYEMYATIPTRVKEILFEL